MKQHTEAFNSRILFVMIQIILYVSFLTLDLAGKSLTLSSYIKFTVIILCFCYALFSKSDDKSISLCLKAALFFTLVSDLFILILDYYIYGVLTFIIVQQLYSFLLCLKKRQRGAVANQSLFSRYAMWFAAQISGSIMIYIVLFFSGVTFDSLLIVSVFYFICILTNTIRAVFAAISNPKDKGIVLYSIGMVLFLLCDMNVGLFNLSGFITMPDQVYQVIYSLSSILMWTFYAPAQVLIALSVKENKVQIHQNLQK